MFTKYGRNELFTVINGEPKYLREATSQEVLGVFNDLNNGGNGEILVNIDGQMHTCQILSEVEYTWHTDRLVTDDIAVYDGNMWYYSYRSDDTGAADEFMSDRERFQNGYDHGDNDSKVSATIVDLLTGNEIEWEFGPDDALELIWEELTNDVDGETSDAEVLNFAKKYRLDNNHLANIITERNLATLIRQYRDHRISYE